MAGAANAAPPCPGVYFHLNSAQHSTVKNRDPNLANGAGSDPGTWWRDRVSSYRFVSCVR